MDDEFAQVKKKAESPPKEKSVAKYVRRSSNISGHSFTKSINSYKSSGFGLIRPRKELSNLFG